MAVKTFVYASALLMTSTCAYASQDGMTKQESRLMAGVWQGTLGKTQIRACINEYGDSGSYYYLKYLTPISLEFKDNHFQEQDDSGRWRLSLQDDQLQGTWYLAQRDKTLPISLSRVTAADGATDCSSEAYNQALETRPQIKRGAWQSFNNALEFRELTYGGEMGLELRGAQAGLNKINHWLKQRLTSVELLELYYETRRDFLGRMGTAFSDETGVELSFANDTWLSVRFYRWAAGHGASGISINYTNFDLNTGERFHPWQWFYDTDPDKQTHQLPSGLQAKWFPTGEQEENPEFDCGSTEYGAKGYYHLTLETQDGLDGLRFWEYPRGNGCENEFFLPLSDVAPYLNQTGRQQLGLK